MTWRELSDLDKREIIAYYTMNADIHSDIRQDSLAEKYDVTKRTIRNWLKDLGVTQGAYEKNINEHPQYLEAKDRRLPKSNYYLITWEQNKTPIHESFWKNIMTYCDFLNAQPIVVQGRYLNPTSIWKDKLANEGWSIETNDYQYASRLQVHPFLQVVSEAKVRPTAVHPLSSFETLTGLDTGIIGHPKLHLETMSMPKSYRKKILASTGAITLPNYTESKSGIKGENKHKLGFIIVEIKNDDVFFLRQVEADEQGDFCDLFYKVMDGKVSRISNIEGIVFGDTHFPNHDPRISQANKELVELLNPKNLVYHDIWDAQPVNRHMINNHVGRYKIKDNFISKEIDELLDFLNSIRRKNSYIIRSNHEKWLEDYINRQDWKKDLHNAETYLTYAGYLLSGKADKGLLPFLIEKELGDYYECLTEDDSLRIGKYECGMHGHLGANGTRGGINHFVKTDIPSVTAHSHTTRRKDDSFVVGTNTKYEMGYNKGLTNWLQSNVIIHENGIAQHIIFIEGDYTTLKNKL